MAAVSVFSLGLSSIYFPCRKQDGLAELPGRPVLVGPVGFEPTTNGLREGYRA